MVDDGYDYIAEMYGERTAKSMWAEGRQYSEHLMKYMDPSYNEIGKYEHKACDHHRPGPAGPTICVEHHGPEGDCVGHGDRHGHHDDRFIETDLVAIAPYRSCCKSRPDVAHLSRCHTHFLAEGQTIIKPDMHWDCGPGRVYLFGGLPRVKEDTVSSDRTFENETRLH